MRKNLLFFLPGLLAALALAGAFMAEYGFGLLPCNLCLYQRIPYFLVLLLTIIALPASQKQKKVFLHIMAVLLMFNAGIAVYHVGVEQHWWLASCGGDRLLLAGSIEELHEMLTRTVKIVRCDQPAWSFHGITFAGLNVLFASACAVLAAIIPGRLP